MINLNINEGENTLSFEEAIVKIMKSIADEEIALAKLISSEADKINAFVGKNFDFPTSPTNIEILKFNQSVQKIIDSVTMKEWLLYKKLEMVISLYEKAELNNKHNESFNLIKEIEEE